MAKRINFLSALVLVFLLAGCASRITVVPQNDRSSYSLLNRPDQLMPLTSNVLANYSLNRDYRTQPHILLAKLEKIFFNEPRSEYLAALADVAGKTGMRYKGTPDLAVRYHLSALLYSYCYLALENPAEQEYNPNAVLILRIYNNALAELFCYLNGRGLLHKNSYELTTASGQTITFRSPEYKLSVPVDDIGELLLCADFEPKNFISNSRRFGIGVPLIAQLNQTSSNSRFAENQTLPLTAVLAFDNEGDATFSRCSARLVLADPRKLDKITLSNRTIPLEYDYSTPLAVMADKPLKFNALFYALNPVQAHDQEGLYYFEPVNPDRIPVVLVHGLMSDTKTWMQMLNTLASDPDIRNNYQFWGVTYSSGNPIFSSADLMRKALENERKKLVKKGLPTDKFDRMVLVGHSMGGLISRLATSSSNTAKCLEFLKELGFDRKKFDALSDSDRKSIANVIEFEPLPFVKRVVFISVPHRGASLASTSIGKFGARCVRLPAGIIRRQQSLLSSLFNAPISKDDLPIMTGIDNLAPDDYAIRMLNSLEMNKNIPYHSIIGNRDGYGIPGGSDGIVPYSSSHIDNAASELVVKSGHSAQQNPLAIQELRRILIEHLKTYPDSRVTKPLELTVRRITGLAEDNAKQAKETK